MHIEPGTPLERRYWGEVERRLAPGLVDYLIGQQPDVNQRDYAGVRIVPTALAGHAEVGVDHAVLGRPGGGPLIIGPFAGDRLFGERCLLDLAVAAREVDVPLCVSEMSVTPLAQLVAEAPECWLQIRAAGPFDDVAALARRAIDEGVGTIVLSVQAVAPLGPLPPGVGYPVDDSIDAIGEGTIGSPSGVRRAFALPQWGWDGLERLTGVVRDGGGRMVVKGLLRPEDVRRAVGAGVDAVMASNTGGRHFDRLVSVPSRLAGLVDAADGVPVLADGGIRRGVDVAAALGLGAHAAVVVRPLVAAAVAEGADGAVALLRSYLGELRRVCADLGVAAPAELTADGFVAPA
ncbi:MAG: alpha-hydroxy-acid oxidizing protein [Actinomycetota bacterium]|nr:alpha-hydroxy-acid oxidizing protein [Actinomycetota bacterium]